MEKWSQYAGQPVLTAGEVNRSLSFPKIGHHLFQKIQIIAEKLRNLKDIKILENETALSYMIIKIKSTENTCYKIDTIICLKMKQKTLKTMLMRKKTKGNTNIFWAQ